MHFTVLSPFNMKLQKTSLFSFTSLMSLTRYHHGSALSVSTSTTTVAKPTPTMNASPKSIAVIGAGAVGGYYGARLWQAGHDVHFYLREPHFSAASNNQGIQVTSVDGDVKCQGHCYSSIDDIPTPVDWIVVALKSSSLPAIPDLIAPLLSPSTRVLVIMNGMIETDLLAMLKRKNKQFACLYGGMALICSNRIGPARIDHSYFGLLSAGVAHTTLDGNEQLDLQAFQQLFQGTIVPVTTEASLLRGRWKKMIWNLPFNGLSVAMGGINVDQIVQDPGLRALARTIMEETVSVANAELLSEYGDGGFEPLGDEEMATMMKLSDDMGPYKPSTMLDFVNRRPMEVAYLFREPLNRAKRLGVPTPVLETVVTQIEAYQRIYSLF